MRSLVFFFFSSRRRHTRLQGDWSSDVCSSDLATGRAARRGRSSRDLWAGARRSRRRSGRRPLLLAGPWLILAARAAPRRGELPLAAVSVPGNRRARPRDVGQLDTLGSAGLRGNLVGGLGAAAGGGARTARGVPARACSRLGRRRSSATGSLDPVAPVRPAVAGQPDWTDGLIQPYLCSVTPRKRTTPHSGPSELAAPFRTSEDLFRLMVGNVKDYAIFMLDVGGRVASWNAGAERIKGYSAEEIIGQHFSRFYPPEDVQAGKPERALQQAAAEGRWEDEGWRVRKDGVRFWANVIITTLHDAEGTPLGFAKLTRDLTERRRAEAVHRQNEERLRLMVDSVKDFAIIMLDREGRVITWNAGAERTHGHRAEEILGRHFSRFYPPEDVAQGKPEWQLERAVRDGQLEDEGWRLRKDGSRFWANVVITWIHDAQRELVGFAKVTRDATERRRAEAEIRRQKGFTEQLINSSTDGILAFDREYRYTLWSEGMARISGVTAEEVMGRPALEVFPFFKDTGEDKHYVAALAG